MEQRKTYPNTTKASSCVLRLHVSDFEEMTSLAKNAEQKSLQANALDLYKIFR
jgi:hypothetical protein